MIIKLLPLQCLVTIIFTNLPSLHPLSFHEMCLLQVLSFSHAHAQEKMTTPSRPDQQCQTPTLLLMDGHCQFS